MRRSERTLSSLVGVGVATVLAAGVALAGPRPADEATDVLIETASSAGTLEPVDVAEPAPEPPVASQRGPKHIAYTPIPHGPKSATVVDDTVDEEEPELPAEPDVASASKEGGQAEKPPKAEKPAAEKPKTEKAKGEETQKKKDHGSEEQRDEKSAKKEHGDHHDGHTHGWWPHGHGEVSSCAADGDQATVDWRAWLYGGEDWTLIDSKGAATQPLGNGKIELTFTGSSGEVHRYDDIVKVKVRAKVTVQHAGGDEKGITLEAWAKPC